LYLYIDLTHVAENQVLKELLTAKSAYVTAEVAIPA
jgi:hypothetical protein